jgi:hypothetical protein
MKSVAMTTNLTQNLSNRRIFRDEISDMDNITIDEIIDRTHRRDGSIISKADTDTMTVSSDCGTTEGSVVASLREKLLDFEQKNHHHYLKNIIIPSKDELEKPLRPKVKPSTKEKPGPTPLPKHTADALVRRMTDHTYSVSTSSMSTPSIFHQRSTPVRLRIKATPVENVQATNEGYASVAKLSKWLADDPTSTKKVKQLRRGANIIAKSRKFDKVLANAEIEHVIPRNCVTRSKILLQKAISSDEGDDNTTYNNGDKSFSLQSKATNPDWTKLGTTASLSVSDKKKWLSHAFQNGPSAETNDSFAIHPQIRMGTGKAKTEIVSSTRDSEIGISAKEKWRQRTTPTKVPATKHDKLLTPTSIKHEVEPMHEISTQVNNQSEPLGMLKAHNLDTVKRHNGSLSSFTDVRQAIVQDNNNNDGNVVDFHSARDMLVQRSKANGNDVDIMTAFQRRKARFQQLEKDSLHRQSLSVCAKNNIYKTNWDTTNHGYTKTYKEDIAPKKSLNDLP